MGDLEFAKVHNSAVLLEDPPATHNDLKFIVDGLKKCCLVHALTTSPAIYQNLIKDFWRSAVVKKDNKDEKYIEATIQGKKVQVSESIIRESLQIDGRSEYSMEINVHQTQDVLDHMGRSGANEISSANTGGITTLASGIEFNFSKFILHELVLNLEGNKRDKFLMYPRFLQIIFNIMHPEPQRRNVTLDLKPVGPKSDQSKSEDQSIPTETEDIVFSTSEPEIKEEHDEDIYGDIDFLKDIEFTRFSDDIPTNTELDLDDEEFGPLPGFASSCFNKVNEVASSATKTGEVGNVLKILLSTSKPMEVPSRQGDVNSEIPPSVSTISTSAPLVSESSQPQTSQSYLERIQSNTSLELPIVAPQVFSIVTTTTIFSPPIQTDEGPTTMFETSGSSSILEYSPTRPSMDEASIRLAKNLAQHSPNSSSRDKGISFREEHSSDDKSSMSELREEIGVL
ncbi:unnamed protein product [Lactuca saligna]|uniref:Uncharacterized protein n=1 Tax=Lactuca saligna TaxID=75948 RepID=A0AA35ZKW6_LACSI|nr:unnamed protein product [Lactuca saligna]